MRIPHTQLELCRSNPAHWLKLRLKPGGASAPQFGMTYDRALRLAIHCFHKSDEVFTRRYLEDLILRQQQKKKFMNRPRVDAIRKDLESYMKWRRSSSDTVIDSDFLLKDAGNTFLTIGGKISRLDLTADGYRAVLFGMPNPNWKQELRMPLIQSLVSEMYNRPLQEISVGFQRLDGKNLQITTYSAMEIKKALKQFRSLAETIEKQSRSSGPPSP